MLPRLPPRPPLDGTPRIAVLSQREPMRWLIAGWHDFRRCPAIGLFYGGCFAAMGWLLFLAFLYSPAFLSMLFVGFVIVAPVMCLGLYRASQRLERGEKPDFAETLFAWEHCAGAVALFAVAMLLLVFLYARVTLTLFTQHFHNLDDVPLSVSDWLQLRHLVFVAFWCAATLAFLLVAFALNVVSVPLMLDRDVDARTAAVTSLRACAQRPSVMLRWAIMIGLLVLMSMGTALVALVIVGPVLGHASWHAYRAVLE